MRLLLYSGPRSKNLSTSSVSFVNNRCLAFKLDISPTIPSKIVQLFSFLSTIRITEDMVLGMGGRDSDNFSKFLSIAGAAFVSLRRHNNVRILMALLRNMAYSKLPDISKNQNAGGALMAMHDRFRLDLSEEDSISFIEKLIEKSISSKIWIAVDTMHSLGKRF